MANVDDSPWASISSGRVTPYTRLSQKLDFTYILMIDDLTLGAPKSWAASSSSGDGTEASRGFKSPFDGRRESGGGGSKERSKGVSGGVYLYKVGEYVRVSAVSFRVVSPPSGWLIATVQI